MGVLLQTILRLIVKGGYPAAKHPFDNGRRQIAFAAPSPESPGVVQERYRGFCDALCGQGIMVRPEHCFEIETLYESGVEAGKQIAAFPIGFTAAAAMADVELVERVCQST